MLTVFGRKTSSNVQALMWGVGELGLAYERHDCGEVIGGLDTPEFQAMNPHRRIPVLVLENGEALFETAAILRFLAGRNGSETFWPADPVARAKVDMWADWAKNDIAANFTGPVFWRTTRTAPERQDSAAIALALENFEAELATADTRLAEHSYLCGAHFTLADIMFGHVLYRYFDTGLARKPTPNVLKYYEKLAQRPAYQEHVMVSYDALRNTF
ncbi:MAG: glutathione S-transferase family protein [Rhodobacteraceae bacterium]|nr:glutathione S-transferase family protein [Paracoccaceae bacterium]